MYIIYDHAVLIIPIERQGKVKSTDEQLEALKEASQRLKVEEKQVKEELGWFERELSVARSKVTAAQSQVDGLYLIMSRIANNEVITTTFSFVHN